MSHYEIVNNTQMGEYEGWKIWEQESRCAKTGRARFRFFAKRLEDGNDLIAGRRTQKEVEDAIDLADAEARDEDEEDRRARLQPI